MAWRKVVVATAAVVVAPPLVMHKNLGTNENSSVGGSRRSKAVNEKQDSFLPMNSSETSNPKEYFGKKIVDYMSSKFRSESNKKPDTIDSSPCKEEKRVVLIGCTGHGKGAFGNFLNSLGQSMPGQPLPFGESSKLDPDTQNPYIKPLDIRNSPNASKERHGMLYKILDTPGLNDIGRDKDLKHMMGVLRMIGKEFKSVHSLVLVYRFKNRADASIAPALRYYRDLFSPLFRAHNVILVLTHVSSDDYERGMEKQTFNKDVDEHLKQINEILELNKPEWNCPIAECYFVNSKWSDGKLDKLLTDIHNDADFGNTDLLYTSYLMRERILDHISEAHNISLDKQFISLPPALEIERTSALKVINGRIKELLDTVSIENKLRAEKLSLIEDLRTKLTKTQEEISKCRAEIAQLQEIKKTPLQCIAGDDWIKFTTAGTYTVTTPCSMKSSGHSCDCEYKYASHNASHPSDYPKIAERTWTVKINPNFINITKKENRYWFYKFWLEYDGKCHNATELQREEKRLLTLEDGRRQLKKELENAINSLRTSEKQLREHHESLQLLDEHKDILLPTQFPLSKIDSILSCMEKYMK